MFRTTRTMLAVAATVAFAVPAFAGPPTATTTTLTFSKNPADMGDAVTVTGTVTAVGGPVEGKIRIKQYLVNNIAVSCGAWTAAPAGERTDPIVSELDPVNSGANTGLFSTSIAADTSVAGSYGFSAQYVPSQAGGAFHQSQSGCVDLIVQEANTCAPSGLSIAITESSGSSLALPGTTYTGGFKVTVQNCGPGAAPWVTAQGGTSGWSQYTGMVADTGTPLIRKQNKQTEVILWSIGNMAENTRANLQVNLTGAIKSKAQPGDVLFLSGPWSATSAGVKTDYTGRVFITVDSATP
jgi:hypothetical protein